MSDVLEAADRLARAAVFACRQHAGQMRDDNITPYAVHSLRVTEYLRRLAGETDEDVLCAALLHDTIEDSALNYDVLANQFGDEVAGLVAELTNDNRLPKAKRRAAMLRHAKDLSPRAKRIKLADRLDNVTDLLRGMGTFEKRARYVAETEHLLQALAGGCAPLEQALHDALNRLRAAP